MKAKIRDAWADALESGDFKQGDSALGWEQSDGERRYCCLGVLCELAARADVIPEAEAHGDILHYTNTSTYLPEEVRVWAGLDSVDPDLRELRASSWNDVQNATFEDIAEMVRELPAE